MTTKDSSLDLDLPSDILDLGCILAESAASNWTVGCASGVQASPEVLDGMIAELLKKVRKDKVACKALGFRGGGDSGAEQIRLKIIALLSWQALRLSRDLFELGNLAAATADKKAPPAKALLRARHEIGVMLAEDVLIGIAEGCDRQFDKAQLPSKTLEWLSGGASSRGCLTPNKLSNIVLPNGAPTANEAPSAGSKPIPSVAELQTQICGNVVGLDAQVKALSSLIVMHLARARLFRQGLEPGTGNQAVLLVGNSGCGKTFLMDSAAQAAGCPFASMSATAITAEGYVGGKLDDLFKSLLMRAKGDLQTARFGIAFTDEWDKKAIREGQDVTTVSVQQEVLVPMQGAEFLISGKRAMERPFMFDSRGTFFAFAGAFSGLHEIIRKRVTQSGIGFYSAGTIRPSDYLLDAIRDYGYVREFVNRLTSVMWLPDPTLASLEKAAATGILDRFNILLGELGILLFPQPDAIPRIAEYALESKTFYRGVKSVWWSIAEMIVASGYKDTALIGVADVETAIARVSSGSLGEAMNMQVSA